MINKLKFINNINQLSLILKRSLTTSQNKLQPSTKSEKAKAKAKARQAKRREKLKKLQAQAMIKGVPKVFQEVLINIKHDEISSCCIKEAIQETILQHNLMIKNHSVIEGTARFALIRLYAIQMLEGSNIDSPLRVAVGKKDRWPSILNKMRPLYYRVRDYNCRSSDQIIRSILYLNRLCSGNSVIDTTEIVKKFRVSETFKSQYKNFLKERFPTVEYGELITKPTLRVTSSGPNSKPKWQTAELEAYALMHTEYASHFESLCHATGNLDLYKYVQAKAEELTRHDKVRLRYIVSIPDKGNKSRVVAISDYWTQVLLEPIMADVKSWTLSTYSDVVSTSDHTVGFNKLKKFIRPGIKSYDIKSWTDALPHDLQHIWMEHRYGKTIADAWFKLVVDCEWNIKGSKSTIKYGRGQGMGTAGSFDIATATDITIIDMIYRQHYNIVPSEETYNKVGDDLWCYDPDKHLLKTFTEEMGMEISIPKTKEATGNNLCAEFVSRNINRGLDVSRISANICRAVQRNVLDLPELAKHLAERREDSKPINIKSILNLAGIKPESELTYVRVFYTMCKMYQNRPGMNYLMYSLIDSYLDVIKTDEFICFIKSDRGLEMFKNSYYLYSGSKLLNSIVEKSEQIYSDSSKFETSSQLSSFSDPSEWWLDQTESLALKTSKMALSQSSTAHDEIYDKNTDSELAISKLERILRSLTFKELGVISSTQRPLRPTVTRIFNLIKTVVVLTEEKARDDFIEYNEHHLSDSGKVISISIDMENRVMLPSVTENYLCLKGLPQLPNDY